MANNNVFKSPVVSSPSPAMVAAQENGTVSQQWAPGAEAPITEATWEWGETPTEGKYIIVETTFSGSSFQQPQLGTGTKVSKRLAYLWPGSLYWTENVKKGGYRLFASLSAMALNRNKDGAPILDEEGELTFNEGIQVRLYQQGLTKAQRQQIAELESAKAIKPELVQAIDGMIAGIQAQAGWVGQKLASRSFVSGVCRTGDVLPPVTLNINFPLNPKEAQSFVKAAANLKGEAALLRFYIPIDRVAMPKEEWQPVKTKVGNSVIDLVHPTTGKAITGPVFSWGSSRQPVARIELVPGKYLPSSMGVERIWSQAESDKIVDDIQRTWQSSEETDLRLWAEALKGRFTSNGNQWAHKGGALPKRAGGQYESSCQFWIDTKESQAKFDKWAEQLRAQVGEKPRLTEENQKSNSNKLFSSEACEAIIQAASVQSIQPWVDFVNSVGGGSTIAPVATTSVSPAVVEVVPSEPEVKAIVEEPKAESSEATLSDADYLAAIMAMREEQSLDDLEEEDLTADFFGGNIQE